ncbi:putative Chloroacetanilide N-alkylformylase, ferredoxin reductase component [Hyphomicrobiales bacterium]|nr:putative Chloroacetanilide N-alkylformylase, ferredoxin reductase component [Hyphomicrobiales bacterium]
MMNDKKLQAAEEPRMAETSDGSVIIVGAGQAGGEAAMSLRRDGFNGKICLIGKEAYPPYERPPLSKKALIGELPFDRLILRTAEAYAAAGIKLILDQAVASIDPSSSSVVLQDARRMPFSHCILATGASARRMRIPGAELPGVLVLRGIDDTTALQSKIKSGLRVVVAGGGYLGLEAAASASKLGAAVTVIEAGKAILQRSTSTISAHALLARHQAASVNIITGESIERIDGVESAEQVLLSSGRTIPADLVLIAIGAIPETQLAQDIGIICDNGIVVDESCRTNIPNIFAIGDCANHFNTRYGRHLRFESVQSATFQARCASAAIVGKKQPPPRIPYFWSEQFDAKLQIAGFVDPSVPVVDILAGDPASDFAVYRFQEGILAAVETVNRPRDFVLAQTLIGRSDVQVPVA